jgi:hypothetical protein
VTTELFVIKISFFEFKKNYGVLISNIMNLLFGFLSLLLAAVSSLFIVVGAGGNARTGVESYSPEYIRGAAIGVVAFVLLTVFFFYRHFRGHPEKTLFPPSGPGTPSHA